MKGICTGAILWDLGVPWGGGGGGWGVKFFFFLEIQIDFVCELLT